MDKGVELDAEKMERFKNILNYLSSRSKLNPYIEKLNNEQEIKMINQSDKYLQTDLMIKTLNYKTIGNELSNESISYSMDGYSSVSFEKLSGNLVAEMSAYADQLKSEQREKYNLIISEDRKDGIVTVENFEPLHLNIVDSLQSKYANLWQIPGHKNGDELKLYYFTYNLNGSKFTVLLRQFSIVESEDGYKIESLRLNLLK